MFMITVLSSVMELLTEDPSLSPLLTPYWNIGVTIQECANIFHTNYFCILCLVRYTVAAKSIGF